MEGAEATPGSGWRVLEVPVVEAGSQSAPAGRVLVFEMATSTRDASLLTLTFSTCPAKCRTRLAVTVSPTVRFSSFSVSTANPVLRRVPHTGRAEES